MSDAEQQVDGGLSEIVCPRESADPSSRLPASDHARPPNPTEHRHGYVLLAGAIVSEVIAALSLRASEGFSKPLYTVLVAVGHLAAFTALSFALDRGLPLAVAYSIWAAAGLAAVTLLSVPLFGESLTPIQGVGLALVISGAIAREIGGTH